MADRRITTGSGFAEANRVQYEAVNAAEAARVAGDTAEVERQEQRAANAEDAQKEYTREKYS
ncbi:MULTISPECIES: hypothetical protein [unclassified Streptomyces]|uniref:hypothetical protein n=1 Tax=unclassified Streptomyces TaxID=2593676 RepID=UPI00114CF786|nr:MULTISPECIES: hypothetical protein [unclassified Streptomyces]MYR95470.1 hypothetical protein [Streptomyces sp. SID4937]